jgi:hypothetical protein
LLARLATTLSTDAEVVVLLIVCLIADFVVCLMVYLSGWVVEAVGYVLVVLVLVV